LTQLTINIKNVHISRTTLSEVLPKEDLRVTGALVVPIPRFTKLLADGTQLPADSDRTDHVAVIDHSAGLTWTVESLGSTEDADDGITQEACVQRCRDLSLLGHSDWRLPTRTELAALVDDTRYKPAIDTSVFPRVKPRWHWTSTSLAEEAGSSASAWYVSFGGGGVSDVLRYGYGFALAVRRAGQ